MRHYKRTHRRRRGGDSGATGYVSQVLGPLSTQIQQSLYSQPWNNPISAQSNQSVPQPSSGLNQNIGTAPQNVDLGLLQRGGRRRRASRKHRRRRTRRQRR